MDGRAWVCPNLQRPYYHTRGSEGSERSTMREPKFKSACHGAAPEIATVIAGDDHACISANCSIDPLRKKVAGCQFCCHVGRGHGRVLTQILALSHSKNLMPFFVRLTAKMAVSGSFLVLRFPEGERL